MLNILLILCHALSSPCLQQAFKQACRQLLQECTNDHICSYDLFVETAHYQLSPEPVSDGRYIKELQQDYVYFSTELGKKTFSCLREECPNEVPVMVDREELIKRSSVEECMIRQGCELFTESKECVCQKV